MAARAADQETAMNKNTILETFVFDRGYIGLVVDDIPEGRMTEMPGKVGTHPAWQLGHMADTLDGCIKLLGGEGRFDEKWQGKFGRDTVPVADPKAYPSKSELIDALDERRETLVKVLKKTPDATFETELPLEEFRPFFPTIGRFLTFLLLSHEGMHCGQIAVWRKAAGLPQGLSRAEQLVAQPAGA